jgi:hypothetical protein
VDLVKNLKGGLMNSCNLSFSVVKARNGQKIPVVGEVHLHSAYNPEREAEAVVEANRDRIQEKKYILVFGLGFAYHVQAIYNYAKNYHKEFEIVVIEPNNEVTISCAENNLLTNYDNLTIYSGKKIENLFNDEKFINFLIKKPALIQHAPSFNMYKEYFTALLTYQASETIADVYNGTSNDEIKSYLTDFDQDDSLYTCIELMGYKDTKDPKKYYFWKSLAEVIKSGSNKARGEL